MSSDVEQNLIIGVTTVPADALFAPHSRYYRFISERCILHLLPLNNLRPS